MGLIAFGGIESRNGMLQENGSSKSREERRR